MTPNHDITSDCSLIVVIEECSNGDVRLVGGGHELEGRVEVCYEEEYGSVCGSGFDQYAAAVVCRQLGYSSLFGKI